MFKTIWSSLIIGALFRLAADFSGFVAPLGIRTIVAYVKTNSIPRNNSSLAGEGEEAGLPVAEHLTLSEMMSNGYVMAVVILFSAILQSTFSQCSTFLVNSEGIHIKIALQVFENDPDFNIVIRNIEVRINMVLFLPPLLVEDFMT
jgi:hypothetical protein